MRERLRVAISGLAVLGVIWATASTTHSSPVGVVSAVKSEPAPPTDQPYIGFKECASCHFKQFVSWKNTKHAATFKLLPAKYRSEGTCLKCHTTGFGKPTGFKDVISTPTLAGNTCEMCHGPGGRHAEICKGFGKTLDEADEKKARDSIWRIIPTNICIECHLTKAHKESVTPKELRNE